VKARTSQSPSDVSFGTVAAALAALMMALAVYVTS
jgi:hypothetical protein